MLELPHSYWEGEDGWLVGYLNEYPEQWTQGKNIKELEEMLYDLYVNFQEESKTGVMEQIPRHADIEENLAKNIIRRLS